MCHHGNNFHFKRQKNGKTKRNENFIHNKSFEMSNAMRQPLQLTIKSIFRCFYEEKMKTNIRLIVVNYDCWNYFMMCVAFFSLLAERMPRSIFSHFVSLCVRSFGSLVGSFVHSNVKLNQLILLDAMQLIDTMLDPQTIKIY